MPVKYFPKLLLYGPPGSGKTSLAGTAPKPKFYDDENSTLVLAHTPELKWIVEQGRIVKYPEPRALFEMIAKDIKNPEVETVVIDSFTTFVDTEIQDHLEREAGRPNSKRDEFVRFDTDYGPATNIFGKLFTKLQRAPINVILIGHERFDRSNDREQTVTRVYPYVTPALRSSVTRLVDVVGYLDIKPGSSTRTAERKLYVNPTGLIEAKNRLHIQEQFLVNPTWDTIFGKKETDE